MAKTELPYMHILKVSGVDLSLIAGVTTLWKDGTKYHALERCGRRSYYYRSGATAVRIDPTTLAASKVCPRCFDTLFQKSPHWQQLSRLASAISPDDARILRRKPSLTDAPSHAHRLEQVITRLTGLALTSEVELLRNDLVQSLRHRLNSLTKHARSESEVARVRRRISAVASTRSERYGLPDHARSWAAVSHGSQWQAREVYTTHAEAFASALAEGTEVAAARTAAVEGLVTGAELRSMNQLDVPQVATPGTAQAAAMASWSAALTALTTSLVDDWVTRYEGYLASEDLVLYQVTNYATEDLKDLQAAVQTWRVGSKGSWNVILAPRGVAEAIQSVERSRSSRTGPAIVPADDVERQVAELAVSLWEPGLSKALLSTLEEALDAARSITS